MLTFFDSLFLADIEDDPSLEEFGLAPSEYDPVLDYLYDADAYADPVAMTDPTFFEYDDRGVIDVAAT